MMIERLLNAIDRSSIWADGKEVPVSALADAMASHPAPWAPHDRVAVVEERGVAQLAAVLAIWARGGVPILGASNTDLEAWRGPGTLWRWAGDRGRHGSAGATDHETAFIHRTSGTIGASKFARRSFASLMQEADGYCGCYGLRAGERAYLAAPIEHSFAFGAAFGLMAAGAVLDLSPKFSPKALAQRLLDGATDVVILTPTMAQLALQSALQPPPERPVRCVIAGAGPVSDALNASFRKRFGVPIARNYGSSETGATLGLSYHAGESVVGRPFEGIRLLAPKPGGVGELVLGLRSAVLGYEGIPQDVKSHARRWRTGDLVELREDGHVVLRGRLDDRVKINGTLVDLGVLEKFVAGLPGVREAVALAEPRQGRPEIADLVIFCVAEPNHLREIAAAVEPAMGCVASVRHLNALPRTVAGKPDKTALRRMLAETSAASKIAARDE